MFIYGLIAAFSTIIFKSGKSVFTKIAASETDEYITSWATKVIGFIITGLLILYSKEIIIPTENTFFFLLLIHAVISILATVLITIGFKKSDVSIIAPLLSFVPLFSIFPAIVFLNQIPTIISGFGIIFVTIGTYIINIQEKEDNLLKPIYGLYYNSGVRYALCGVLISSFIPTTSTLGLNYVSEIVWAFMVGSITSSILLVIVYFKSSKPTQNLNENWFILFVLGLFNICLVLSQLYAYNYINVAYVQSIKQLNILIVIVVGSIFFNEPHFKQRLISGSIIVIGAIMILFGM